MGFQTTVRYDQAFGVPGELSKDGPTRAEPGVLLSADAANNVFGRVFTKLAAGTKWRAGNPDGLGVVFGIMIGPKAHAAYGTVAGGPLAPTLTIPNEVVAQFLTMGFVVVVSLTACDLSSEVRFVKATGEIKCVAAGAAVDALLSPLPTAKVEGVAQPAAPGLIELRITQ